MWKMRDKTGVYLKYQNKWVAFTPDERERVVASGKSLEEVLNKAKLKGFQEPVVEKIPNLKHDYILNASF